MPTDRIHFVTGKLAASALRETLSAFGTDAGFQFTIDVLPITVAALMTPGWIARHWTVPSETTQVLLPGYCRGDLTELQRHAGVPVQRGPRDLRALPEFFGQSVVRSDYGQFDIQVLAEINHAPRLEMAELLRTADQLKRHGADLIDIGCEPGHTWNQVGDCVTALRDAGHRVAIDSMNLVETELAVRAGAELVLSVNSTNREAAADWGCEVVVVPDDPKTMSEFAATVCRLQDDDVPFRLDPILEPIGFGLAASLGRYLDVRRQFPQAQMMMGIGNLTELTDCDSAAINVLLLGFCQEVGIRSVLTTEVINWARSSVRECDLARRLVYHAVTKQVLPKHVESRLVMLRDERVYEQGAAALDALASEIRDHNYRLFGEGGEIHVVSRQLHEADADPFLLFDRLYSQRPETIDASHAFYLGYEMAKAVTALQLGKQYRQDEALDWGLMTVAEESHRLRRTAQARRAVSSRPSATAEDELK